MTFVRPIALAACIAISTASALAVAQQTPSDTTSPSQTTPPSTSSPQSPSSTSPSYGSMDTQNLTATQKQQLKTCMDTQKAKNDGSTKDQMKQTCMTQLGQSPQN